MRYSATPLVVGVGGTVGGPSSTERALAIAMRAARAAGLRTRAFGGAELEQLPLYNPRAALRTPAEQSFVEAVRGATAMIIASPGYHGNISGAVKNALDLIEETARDRRRPYLADMPVGLIATAYGWQATGSTIAALRSIVHALRGWPTPFAAGINCQMVKFDDAGGASDPEVLAQLAMVGDQVARFAKLTAAAPCSTPDRQTEWAKAETASLANPRSSIHAESMVAASASLALPLGPLK